VSATLAEARSANRVEPLPAIVVEQVSKVFMIPAERAFSLKRQVLSGLRRGPVRRFDALEDVSLTVGSGEFFGVIGHNGSGKSTLLKILARIYQPTRGRVQINGRLSPFIELGVGFNPDLTARENTFLNGAILGLTRAQVEDRFDEIIGFAELEEFVDQKLKNFSSGMLVRLAFAVAIQAHADILLIDEVLAVGDAEFQRKCFDVFRRLKAEGKTIVLVSHDLASIKEFSDHVLLLDHGRAVGVFPPSTAIARYQQLNEERADRALVRAERAPARAGGDRPQLAGIRLLNSERHETHVLHSGEAATLELDIDNPSGAVLNAGLAIMRSDGLYCMGTNTFLQDLDLPRSARVRVRVDFPSFTLQQGTYNLTVGLFGESDSRVYEMTEGIHEFQVSQRDSYVGVVLMAHRWAAG
jgi:ABC-type polysaccharide/polyol phosphate transport system ATPase subunit